VVAIVPYYWIRAIGGLLYLIGFFMFTYNIYKSIACGKVLDKEPKSASPMAA
ncbi:cytochrome C oxidase Cbb3, partial [Campylobacter jejuni]